MSDLGDNTKAQLKSIIERIEAIEAEIKERQTDRSDIYKEAGGNGYNVKALRNVIAIRKQDPDERREQAAVLETYLHALGMLEGA